MSGSINIPGYQSNNRVPGIFASIDASKANTATINQRSLMFVQMLPAGSAAAGMPVISAGIGEAIASYGAGSIAALAVERYRNLDLTGELWVVPLADAAGAVEAAGAVAFTGPATGAGTIPLRVNSTFLGCPVNSGDTATIIATNAAATINNYASTGGNPLPVVATASAGTVAISARNGGTLGNTISITLSFLGTGAGEGQPGSCNVPGVAATITPMTGGATDPTISSALANVPETPYDFILCPFSDVTSLNALQAFLGDAAGRWNWSVELFGGVFTSKGGSLSTRTTWSTGRNDQHATAIGAYGSPDPDWAWALDYMAASAVSIRSNPTVPIGGLQGGVALNVMAPPLALRDTFAERETLLFDGMSTYIVDPARVVHIDRAITTYQFNAAGAPDNSYLNLNVPYQLMAFLRVLDTMLGSNFNRSILVADGSRIPPGSAMITSATIATSIVALYRQVATNGVPGAPAGLVQNPARFAAGIQHENAGGGIAKLMLPLELGNQLIAIGLNVQFSQP